MSPAMTVPVARGMRASLGGPVGGHPGGGRPRPRRPGRIMGSLASGAGHRSAQRVASRWLCLQNYENEWSGRRGWPRPPIRLAFLFIGFCLVIYISILIAESGERAALFLSVGRNNGPLL